MIRRKASVDEKRANGLTVCTWNVLADCCCDDSDNGFPYASERARDPTERARKQLLIIAVENPDLLALQEVDKPKRFQPFLEEIGYEVTYFKRHGSPLGTMIAIKKALEFVCWNKADLPQNRFFIGVTFYYKGAIFEFWTTHLKAKAEGEQARIEQAESIAFFLNDKNTNYIVAGDFNDHPDSKCIKILKEAGFRNASENYVRLLSRPFTTFKTRRDATGHPDQQKKTEDYIFFKGSNIVLTGFEEGDYVSWAIENNTLELRPPGLPSEQFPSDHLPVNAIFAVKGTSEVPKQRSTSERLIQVYDDRPTLEESSYPGAYVFPPVSGLVRTTRMDLVLQKLGEGTTIYDKKLETQ